MPERLAGIVRVSYMGTRKAGDANVHADRDQLEAIERYAHSRGARLKVLPPELDVSGGLPLEKRPSLLAAIEGVEAGHYDGIVVAYLSRLGRNVREQLRAWDRVEAAGGRIVCIQEDFDTSTPHGRYMRTLMLANAEHERELHTERFKNLRQWATEAGLWQRRQTPRGYRRDPDTRRLVPDAQADEVRTAFRDFAAGRATRVALAARLGMTPSGVRAMLRNRVYLGELRVGEYVNPHAHATGRQRHPRCRPTAAGCSPAPATRRVRGTRPPCRDRALRRLRTQNVPRRRRRPRPGLYLPEEPQRRAVPGARGRHGSSARRVR